MAKLALYEEKLTRLRYTIENRTSHIVVNSNN